MKLLPVCPHCKKHIELCFEHLVWTDNGEAFYKCQSCGCQITDDDKIDMLLNATEERPFETDQLVSILFNALYSPFVSFAEIVQEFKQCRTDKQKLDNFVRYWLGKELE